MEYDRRQVGVRGVRSDEWRRVRERDRMTGNACLPVLLALGHAKITFGWSSEYGEQTSYGKLWGWWAESVVFWGASRNPRWPEESEQEAAEPKMRTNKDAEARQILLSCSYWHNGTILGIKYFSSIWCLFVLTSMLQPPICKMRFCNSVCRPTSQRVYVWWNRWMLEALICLF